jgi:hypothetical protein
MRKTCRYSIQIKDAKGSVVFATGAFWDGDDRRIAVAKILRLDGVIEAPSCPFHSPDPDLATNFDAASFAISTPAKKNPRH